MDHLEQKILNIIDEHAEELEAIASHIYYHAERGFAEYETAKAAAEFLRKYGMEPREGLALTGVKANINEAERFSSAGTPKNTAFPPSAAFTSGSFNASAAPMMAMSCAS